MKLDITKTNIKYNNYSGSPFEIQFLKAITLETFKPLYALNKVKNENDAIRSQITEF